MHRTFLVAGLLLLAMCGQAAVRAQEPAYFVGRPGIRFKQSPNVFHYIYPCDTGLELSYPIQIASKLTGPSERALCWPVWALRMSKNGSTYDASAVASGRIVISAHDLRFLPNDNKNADLYADFHTEETQFQHKPGEAFAFFGIKDVFFKFGFSNLCSSCANGTPVPSTTNTTQLEQEFGFVQAGVKQFESTWQQIHDLSAKIRVEIRPSNQPGVSDIAESLRLYSDLNTRLAEMCAEPAKSCIVAFASFEKCKSASWSAECGPRPACSEACTLTSQDLRKLNARGCVQYDEQGASLYPDWSDVVKKKTTNDLPSRSFVAGVVEFEMKSGPNPPSAAGCSVNASFVRAGMPPPPAFGVAGMEGLGGPGAPGVLFAKPGPVPGAPKKVAISAGVAAAMIVKKVQPVYPPVAKAARVQGIVVLHAIITKEGDVSDLHVIDGPPLLQEAAVDAVKQWQYKPYLINGEAVEAETTINVIFSLGDPPAPETAPTRLPAPPPGQP